MKFVLQEPPSWTRRTVDIHMDKLDGDASITVKHGDNDEVIGTIQIEPETRNVIWKTTDTEKFSVVDSQGNHVSTGNGVSNNMDAPDSHKDGRYWSIEKMHFCTTTGDYLPDTEAINACYQDDKRGKITIEDHLVVSLPNGKSISLKVHKPGPYTPDFEPHEIYGQAEMVFNLMLAIKLGKHSILKGPTGLGKTTVYQWLAKKLGYNLFMQPISRGTQDRHMVGEYAPAGPGDFKWTYGPVSKATMASQTHPTILVFDELNRIGNVAEFARIYSLLDDSKMIELSEKRSNDGTVETLKAGQLFVGGTANPADDDDADYIGVRELDPALNSRFGIQPTIKYPEEEIEMQALRERVPTLDKRTARMIVGTANRIRNATEVRFPISFREIESWALALQYHSYTDAAEIAVIAKAPSLYRNQLRNLLKLQDGKPNA